ncbi:MAG TPA: nitroreductase family protein [Patescibacteria group bacterium]|nr:nitroreductase family protein [Patescibacteria group bacterium]
MTDRTPSPRVLVRPLLRVRQIRHFTAEPPTDDELAAIADAGRWSGSSRNTQPWRFIVVRDRDALRQIHDAGLPQMRSLATALTAIAIVVPDDDDPLSIAYDEGRAAERMLIAASFLGLGAAIAWALPAIRPLVGSLLGVPDGWFIRTLVVVGHTAPEALAPKSAPGKARLPRENVVFEGTWPADRQDA